MPPLSSRAVCMGLMSRNPVMAARSAAAICSASHAQLAELDRVSREMPDGSISPNRSWYKCHER